MSKPRTISLQDGVIKLHGFPKQVADSLEDHIKSYGAPIRQFESSTEQALSLKEVQKSVETSPLPCRAICTRQEGSKWLMEVIVYDPITNECEVELSVESDNRYDVANKFKMKALDLGFVI